jgi:general L-amino acid transport system ATP-binding protein
MDQGEVVEKSPPARFFSQPESDRTKLFLSQILSH